MTALGNHLWQSSVAVCVVALLALALRRNRPHVRYALWCVASVKFLVPFSLLLAVGSRLARLASPPVVYPQMAGAMELISRPFSDALPVASTLPSPPATAGLQTALWIGLVAIWFAGSVVLLAMWLAQWRRMSAVIRAGVRLDGGREWEVLRALERSAGIARPIALVSSSTTLEPGVFGIVRPVLLWSTTLGARLSDAEIDAILAHEVCHVRRRDNLMAAVQMFVETLFWFHPFVWWIERRLVDERERACDADVIRSGRVPHVYAEGLLKICEWYVESPLTCVAGVTGADLKRRVETIMRHDAGMILGAWKKGLVAGVAVAALAIPVVVGVVTAPRLRAQALQPAVAGGTPAFEVASIKRNPDPDGPRLFSAQPGGRVSLVNQTVRQLIYSAYQTQDYRIIGGPAWLNTDRFDIVAKAADAAPPPQMLLMVRTLLAERFNLTMHADKREMPIYRLVMARSDGRMGPELKTSNCAPQNVSPDERGGRVPCGNSGGLGTLSSGGGSMDTLANQLGRQAVIGRPVVNQTGLTGTFDYKLTFALDQAGAGGAADGVSIFTALQEQLGVKLEPATGPVDVLVIDSVEQPTGNQGSPIDPSFEQSKITRTTSVDANARISQSAGGICDSWGWIRASETCFTAISVTVRELIVYAFGPTGLVPPRLELVGGPGWIDAERFDVVARAAGGSPLEPFGSSQLAARMRTLLAERFSLSVHQESRTRPIYELRPARSQEETRVLLQRATADCVDKVKAIRVGASNGPPISRRDSCLSEGGPGYVKGGAIDMPQLSAVLSNRLNRIVRDRTGLAEFFNIDFTWMPGQARPDAIRAALEQELGLTLQPTTDAVAVLVIDHVESPAER